MLRLRSSEGGPARPHTNSTAEEFKLRLRTSSTRSCLGICATSVGFWWSAANGDLAFRILQASRISQERQKLEIVGNFLFPRNPQALATIQSSSLYQVEAARKSTTNNNRCSIAQLSSHRPLP